jgi:hypothetical protein
MGNAEYHMSKLRDICNELKYEAIVLPGIIVLSSYVENIHNMPGYCTAAVSTLATIGMSLEAISAARHYIGYEQDAYPDTRMQSRKKLYQSA